MRHRGPPPAPSSALPGRRWDVTAIGLRLECAHASATVLRTLDEKWPPRRSAGASNAHWCWYEIALRAPERFILCDVSSGDLVAVWSSRAKRPIVLDGHQYYRPDYLEVDPGRREGGLGLFLLAVIACRARELGAEGVVLGGVDTPAARALYSRAGASETTPCGWRPAPGLIPYWIGGDAYLELCEYADAHQESQDEP